MSRQQHTRLSNENFVSLLMSNSEHGALAQVFVVEAIRCYSEMIVSNPVPEDDTSIISGKAWNALANEIHEKVKKRFEVQGTV